MGNLRKLLAWVLVFSMILSAVPMRSVSAEEAGSAVLSALDFGADPTGAADSTVAIQKVCVAYPNTGGGIQLLLGADS